ncbi:uncharacterized protein DUF397 [Actinocorallia herbida]|uniref:Uncharacterized protein DUF397 n=1 Tax=Actinocorallia herbida TaxID=58109 RepID=A0A3N1D1G4_9ACTN|nr:DUF397 domain-containing protein [Actinocorallia herbida]ROO87351.1 uncharacterized protein DUF397 [Actinocorallia herbida]
MTQPIWRKSSYSTTGNDEICVELARVSSGIGVRDSKNPEAGPLTLTARQFASLTARVRSTRLS